jgi:hypothetical protein
LQRENFRPAHLEVLPAALTVKPADTNIKFDGHEIPVHTLTLPSGTPIIVFDLNYRFERRVAAIEGAKADGTEVPYYSETAAVRDAMAMAMILRGQEKQSGVATRPRATFAEQGA